MSDPETTDPFSESANAESAAAFQRASDAWEAVKFTPDSPARREVRAAFNQAWLERADFCDARAAARAKAKEPKSVAEIIVEVKAEPAPLVQHQAEQPSDDRQMGLFG